MDTTSVTVVEAPTVSGPQPVITSYDGSSGWLPSAVVVEKKLVSPAS